MGDFGTFFQSRKEAVNAAKQQGLTVTKSGLVESESNERKKNPRGSVADSTAAHEMKLPLTLWRYNSISGYWREVRDVLPENKEAWLEIFRKDEPDIFFKVSKNRPHSMPNIKRKKNPRGSVADSTAAHELILYATNTDKLYPQKMSIVKNIMRRLANGTYDATKAVRLWQYWTDAAAQLYVKEFGTGRVDTVFTAATRRKAAAEIASIEIERIKNFEYGEIIPKRSRGKNPKKGSYAELKPRKEINFRIYAVDKKTGESKYLSTAINLLSAKIIAKAIAHRYPYSRIAVYKE